MDIEVLLWSCESCCSLCLMMEITGSTGTDVKTAFTSYDEMHSPLPLDGLDVLHKMVGVPDVVRSDLPIT